MRLMHARVFAVISVISMLLLAACGGGDEDKATATKAPSATSTASSSTPRPTTTAAPVATNTPATGGLTGTILDKATLSNYELDNVRYGGTFVAPQEGSRALDPKLDNTGLTGDTQWGYEKLLDWAPNLNDEWTTLVPVLAESWKASTDLKVYTFNIRKGVKWHNIAPANGRELVADDVVFSMNRYREKDAVNISAYSQVDDIQAPDKYTVVVTLKSPYAFAVDELFGQLDYVVNPELVKEEGGTLSTRLIGTGPYIMKKFGFRQGSSHVRNPDYWMKDAKGNKLPYVDNIEVPYIGDRATTAAAFRSGQIDWPRGLTVEDYIQIGKTTQLRIFANGSGIGQGFTFNTRIAPWNDVRVRRAFNHMLDKERFGDTVHGKGLWEFKGPLPWNLVADDAMSLAKLGPYAKFDPAAGKKLLVEAGFPDGKLKVATPLPFAAGSTYEPRAQTLQALYKENGIEFELLRMDTASYNPFYFLRDIKDIMLTHQVFSKPNLNWFAQNKFHKLAVQNTAWVDDPQVNKVVDDIRITLDPAKQREYAKFLWDFETLNSITVWTPVGKSYIISSAHTRNDLRRAGTSRNATIVLPWLSDGPRTTP